MNFNRKDAVESLQTILMTKKVPKKWDSGKLESLIDFEHTNLVKATIEEWVSYEVQPHLDENKLLKQKVEFLEEMVRKSNFSPLVPTPAKEDKYYRAGVYAKTLADLSQDVLNVIWGRVDNNNICKFCGNRYLSEEHESSCIISELQKIVDRIPVINLEDYDGVD